MVICITGLRITADTNGLIVEIQHNHRWIKVIEDTEPTSRTIDTVEMFRAIIRNDEPGAELAESPIPGFR